MANKYIDPSQNPFAGGLSTGADSRSVIKNATLTSGKGGTIATKKEIEEQKAAKKPIKVKTEAKKVDTSKALDNVKTPIQTPTTNVNKPITTVPPINTTQDPLKKAVSNIVGTQTVKVTSNSIPEANGSNNALLKIRQEAEEAKKNKTDYAYQNVRNVIQNKVDIDTALEDLFYDIEMNDKQGYSILDADLNQIKNDYKEFNGLDDETLAGLVQDMYGIYKDGIRMDAGGIKEIYQLYPELNMLKTGWFQNYRGGGQIVSGGFRGAINNMVRGFGTTDLNGQQVQYDESGNPIWNAMDKMNVIGNAASNFDRFAQEAFQVQGSEGEEAIRKKLLSMNEDDLADKYREFATWAKNNPTKAREYMQGYIEGSKGAYSVFSDLTNKHYFSPEELNEGFQNWLIDDITKEVYGDKGKWLNVGIAFKEDKKDSVTGVLQKFDDSNYSWLEQISDSMNKKNEEVQSDDSLSDAEKFAFDKLTIISDILETLEDVAWFKPVIGGVGDMPSHANIEKSLNNLPGSSLKTISAITNAFTNPLDTTIGLTNLLFTKEGHEAIKERYGSIEAWAKSWEEDPAGTFSDVLAMGEMGVRGGGLAASLMKKGALNTAVVAELMGGENFSKNALKIANRLEKLEQGLGKTANFLDTTSNFGVNKLKDAMVAGFRKMGNSSNLLVKVGGKYLHMSQAPLQATTELLKNLESGGLVKDATRLAQQITQGDKKTGEAFIRAKESGYLDTEGVKDYKDLQDRVKQGERAYGEDIDSVLKDEEGMVTKENTTERTADGTEYNRYQDAIDGLKELYEKTGDYEGLDLIKKLEEKFNGEGLTKAEAKKLIASYGREFNSKGWGKNGEALTSQSAEKVQNTKNGMNEWLKNNISEEARAAMEIIDRSYGDLKTVERSLNKIQKRLENMDKSVESGGGLRNTVGNAAAAIGIITDVLGGHGIWTIAGLIVKNLTKTPSKLNIKGIEKKLSNNLERLDKTLNIVNKRKSSASVGLLATTLHKMGVINDTKYNQVKNLLNGNTTEKIKPSNLVKGLAKKEGSALRDDLISVIKELDEVEQFKDMRDVLNFFKNKLSEADYKAVDKVLTGKEYDYAQGKSRVKGGDRESRMARGDRDSVVKWVKEHSNNPGYVVRLLDETGMMKALVEAGDVAQKGVEGFKDPYNKYINLLKNPLDTTAQHEFFHAVFEVIDKKTKDKILAEAKKILKQENMSDEAAEEWLAESFGIYAKRKMFDAGILKGKKGWTAKLERMVRDFFQKAYEWIQNFNGDRETINKIFEEIYGGNTKIGENGLLDLSYLLEEDKKLGIKDTKLDTKEVKAEVKPKALEKKPESKPIEKKEKPLEVKKETRREILGDKFYKDLEKQVEIINESRKGIAEPITVEELDLSSELYEKEFNKIADAEMKEIQDEYSKIQAEHDKMYPQAKKARELSAEQQKQLDNAPSQEAKDELLDKWRKEYNEKYPLTDEQLKKVEELVNKGTEMANRHGKVRQYLWEQQQNRGNNIRKKAVYHGSPADFDKFDSSHMGEGEGAQAHGWGHYVAVNEKTGRHYADMGGEPSFEYNGKKIWDLKGAEREVADSMETNITRWDYDFEESKSGLKERYENGIKRNKERLLDKGETDAGRDVANREIEKYKGMLKILDKMDENNFVLTPNKNLYTLDIPDTVKKDTPTGSNYLEEKAELTPKKFSEFMDILKEKKPDIFENPVHMDPLLTFFKEGQKIEGVNGAGLYNTLENVLGGSKEASKFLESLGYDGIHYFGGRDGEAYVIFNDNALQIKDHIRYKKLTKKDMGLDKKSGKDKENMYTLLNKSLSTYPSHVGKESTRLSDFLVKDNTGEYMIINGNPVYPPKGRFTNRGFVGGPEDKHIHSETYRFPMRKGYEAYSNNIREVVARAGEYSKVYNNDWGKVIGKTELGKNIYFTKGALKHIVKEHGTFDWVNLIETANNPEYTGIEKARFDKNGNGLSRRNLFLKEIPGSDNFYILALEKAGNDYKVTTFFEVSGDDAFSHYTWQKAASDEVRFKKKIGDKDVEITPKVKSPDELIEKNADGLSVMKSFISEKQAEKALNVNKALLDKDGNAYLWTHTNKYEAPQFANFENVNDSRYKEFGDKQIAFSTNLDYMSFAYAKNNSILADTKAPKNLKEFKDLLKNSAKEGRTFESGSLKEWSRDTSYTMDEVDGKYQIRLSQEEKRIYDTLDSGVYDQGGFYAGLDRKEISKLENGKKIELLKEHLEKDKELYISKGAEFSYEIKELKDGRLEVTKRISRPDATYTDEKKMIAEFPTSKTKKQKYHYQLIAQDVKNPLVVDLGKYTKEGRIGAGNGLGIEGKGLGHSRDDLGNAYDLLKKTNPNIDKVFEKINQKWKGAVDGRDYIYPFKSELEKQSGNYYRIMRGLEDGMGKENALNMSNLYANAYSKLDDIYKGTNREFTPEEKALKFEYEGKEYTVGDIADRIESDYEKYGDVYEIFSNGAYTQDKFKDFLKKMGMSDGEISMLHGKIGYSPNLNKYSIFYKDGYLKDALETKQLSTNDYVYYALRDGRYDGVIFKDIVDYGGPVAEGKEYKGGDVLVTFRSNQLKAWDNANPTDSKYISYKKKGLEQKPTLPDTDNDGRKLSEGQKKFFAGSKVVDKDGNLLRVYHGTVAGDFTVFQKYGNRTSNNIASDVGFWFTPNKKGAINFAKESSWRGDNKARAEEVYLDIKNPKVYEPSEFNLKDYEERDKLIDSKYKEVYAARNEMNKYDYNHFWMGEYTHGNHVNRGIFNKLDYIYNQKGKITEADLKDIKEEYGKINWDGYYKPEIDATYEDFKNYLQAKKKYDKLNDEYLEMKHSDSYDDFKADIYKLDNKKRDKLDFALDDMDAAKKYIDNLKKEGYDGIIIKGTEYDGATLGEGARNDQYVAFDSNQIKRITNENPTKNEDIRFKRKNTDDIVGHASPYVFDKYDASKRVTGYGGQVYGAGIYTSEDLGMVAGKYGKKDADRFNSETMYKGLPLREQYDEKYVAQIMHDSMMNGLTFKEAKQEIIDAWEDTKDPNKKAMLKELGLMKKSDFDGKGNLYTYKIDKDGKWLDWQQKTSPEDVNLISKELAKINKEGAKKFDDYMKSSEYATLGQNIYQELSRALGGDQKASDFLKSIGFEGNKYKAESNKYNYVIFDYDKPINEHIRFKKQTDTPEFKKWFEGSKVVDKAGKPLEVYHNTDSDFTEFDINKTKTGLGHFFTSDKKYLNGLKNKMSVYLDIKNPLIASPTNKISKQFPELKKLMERPKESKDWSFDERVKYEQMLDKKFDKELRKILKREGYDGVFYEDDKGNVDQFVALDPSQIKSATDNIGTFDKNNPDIRFKKAGKTTSKEFKDRFGDYTKNPRGDDVSKVLDGNMKPKVVYHGTNKTFTEFIQSDAGGDFPDASYFTDNRATAKGYGDNLMKVYLDIKNPVKLDVYGQTYNQAYDEIRSAMIQAKKNGNDGMIIKNIIDDWAQNGKGKKGTTYVVFEPTQIKSATDNIGTFDKNNPDIRYKKHTLQEWKDKGVKELGYGDFGKSFGGIKGKDAIDFMRDVREGEVLGAYEYNGEPIDLVWGKTNAETNNRGYGLSKIEEKHEHVLDRLDDLLAHTKGVEDEKGLLIYDNGKEMAIVMPHYKGKKKRWVLTAYRKNNEFKEK